MSATTDFDRAIESLDRLTDLTNLESNLKGVFADLDDGGLTESEALEKVREILGNKKPINAVVLSYMVPATITVALDGYDGPASVTEFAINIHGAQLDKDSPAESGIDGESLDAVLYQDEIRRAREVAADTTEWPDPERM